MARESLLSLGQIVRPCRRKARLVNSPGGSANRALAITTDFLIGRNPPGIDSDKNIFEKATPTISSKILTHLRDMVKRKLLASRYSSLFLLKFRDFKAAPPSDNLQPLQCRSRRFRIVSNSLVAHGFLCILFCHRKSSKIGKILLLKQLSKPVGSFTQASTKHE